MPIHRALAIAVVAIAFFVGIAPANPARAEKLVKAEFWSHTNDDNKDKDSGVWVKVVTNDESVELATIENADNSAGDATEYNDNSEHTVKLVVKSDGATMAKCAKFKFKVGMRANGKDKWKFRGKVTLYFDNGQTLVQEVGNTELESKGSTYTELGSWAGGK
ncbi:MAG: hypothetical protein ACJ8C4_18130 [Gemmataceae bacterium]